MGLLSFFQRRSNAAEASPRSVGPHDEVALARTRARRRLLGAAVLVMAGVIGFPLVFETQPRPVPVDRDPAQGRIALADHAARAYAGREGIRCDRRIAA
jgi:DedD protein